MIETNREISSRLWELIQTKNMMIPMWWDYQFDNILYDIMCYDTRRMNAYREAIQRTVKNKKIVDIGAGPTLPLTLMCVEAGAEFVYAIEGNPDVAKQAINFIQQKGIGSKVRVIPKYSSDVFLPEKVDICLSELIGSIGSSEGAVSVLHDAKRLLNNNGLLIPDRCVTMIAPVCLPKNMYQDDFINNLIDSYQKSAYKVKGYEFSTNRFEIYNFPESHLLAEPCVFEDIKFNEELIQVFDNRICFNITSENNFDRFLLWINLYPDSLTQINSFRGTCWGPVFIDHGQEFVTLKEGDKMDLVCRTKLNLNGINPDYFFNGTIFRDNKEIYRFSVTSSY